MSRAATWIAPLGLLALLLFAWEAGVRLSGTPAYLLPGPVAVVEALIARWPLLAASAWTTLSMALWGLGAAAAVAAVLAALSALHPLAERALRPLAVTLQVTPVIAIAPLVVIWAGLDHSARAVVALAAVVAFFPIFSGALTGLKSADPDLERLFDLYGARPLQRLLRLRLPAAVPYLLEGFRVGAGQAVIGAVVAEFVAGSGGAQGLAWRILEAGNRLRTAEMFAALAVLTLLGLGFHALVAAAERRILAAWSGRAR